MRWTCFAFDNQTYKNQFVQAFGHGKLLDSVYTCSSGGLRIFAFVVGYGEILFIARKRLCGNVSLHLAQPNLHHIFRHFHSVFRPSVQGQSADVFDFKKRKKSLDFQPNFLCNYRFARIFFVYFRLLLRCFIAEFGLQHGKLRENYQNDFRDKRIEKL